MRTVAVFASLALAAIACSPTPQTSPSPQSSSAPDGRTGGGVAAAPAAQGPGGAGGPGSPGGPGGAGARRRVPPNPMQQDTVRRALVDSIMATIAGRENEPAGTVFRNVKLLKAVPAGEFLKTMDTQYGRGLGWTCGNCHVLGKWDDDSKKNKRIARQMQEMTEHINTDKLAKVKELDEEYDKATCVMCHHGANEPKGTMAVPPAPPRAAP